ncbi:double-strand break repair helicase AddA [Devosia sp. MC532]|uniref:double-strand break repair helicase AddA n=1 Tax=Devosia sp. MC532 TaxID=2799788 RepID=UPI0018F61912|nr:double-strand break repair helicase AddA [Devosia sp. MC532]MBJ7577302.1 double-strand break repair helicase AddA [Devosia sp. MC532]
MSDRGKLSVPFDTTSSQARASDPTYSIWVEANAGSGKTFVLTRRVLRLLLSGVRPQSILCLTYTKAAAAEMRRRVGNELAAWAVASEEALYKTLSDVSGSAPTKEQLRDARTLFARALETPGGLRILTIHAFCEAVLHRFPIEAGVPFDFAVIEDDRQEQMILSAREGVMADGLRGKENAQAVESLFGLMSDHAISEAIAVALSEGARLEPVLADIAEAKARLRKIAGFSGRSFAEIRADIPAHTLLIADTLTQIRSHCAVKPEGDGCVDVLARLTPETLTAEELRRAFFTKAGEPRKKLLLKADDTGNPGLNDLLTREQERIIALEEEAKASALVERSEAVLDVVAAIHARYEDEKRRHSLLDFDDLIEKLGTLFANKELGPWVQYKLDAGIDHILVDESQDTNGRQWRVVRALADEFFTGEGAIERPRSLFAVGDQKQSIYSFQGAQPVLFGETGREIARRAQLASKNFQAVKLHTSFRTLGSILNAVDKVCSRDDIRAALLSVEPIGHAAARIQTGGSVTLWPPVQEQKTERETTEWPLEPVDGEMSGNRQVAMRIAEEIRSWIDSGRILGERGRPVRADDVLILVQKRGAFFQEVIRALRAKNLPTPGADRLAVTGHIAVLDLLALMDVLLNPADNLQLAALLRSPLFDVSEELLYDFAHDRLANQTLWSAIFASEQPEAVAVKQVLGKWRSQLDMERPFEFLTGVLYAEGGLKRFHARLGTEVDEVISELLELALSHEQSEQPSLQGFVADMRRRSVTIKRELAEGGAGVRVMTVHGSKGLEAPIVILADATAKPSGKQTGKPLYVVAEAPGPLLVHASQSGQHVEETLNIKAASDAQVAEEYWRRLYVAMTRAEDELYVTGTLTASQKLDNSWYEAIEMGLAGELQKVGGEDDEPLSYVFPQHTSPRYLPGGKAESKAAQELVLPAVPEPDVPKIISPSSAEDHGPAEHALDTLAERARDAETARRAGIALHALLQHLVRVERSAWEQVAPRALDALMPGGGEHAEDVQNRAISILSRPEFSALFGPASRPEVPFQINAIKKGEPVVLRGRMDRIVVDDEGVLVIDYKSDANAPSEAGKVSPAYLTQLGLYALVATQLFPGRSVRAGILWTQLESLMILPPERLAEATKDFTLD